jgi:hypothetical protein
MTRKVSGRTLRAEGGRDLDPDLDWHGMSGAAIFSGTRIIAVLVLHQQGGRYDFKGERLDDVLEDTDFAATLATKTDNPISSSILMRQEIKSQASEVIQDPVLNTATELVAATRWALKAYHEEFEAPMGRASRQWSVLKDPDAMALPSEKSDCSLAWISQTRSILRRWAGWPASDFI